MERPQIDSNLDANTFREFYYLKEELVDFCRLEGLQTTGSKQVLTDRIAHYLITGEKLTKRKLSSAKPKKAQSQLSLDTLIEENFVCSEAHRAFYKEHIGTNFSFNVPFQTWLKQNAGETYQESIDAYYRIQIERKNQSTKIGKQFEYNTYIRDFFQDNHDKTLQNAITCWKHKKAIAGTNKYEKEDLHIL